MCIRDRAWSLYKTQEMEVVAGKRLDESPVFSCLVPSTFCPVNGYTIEENHYSLQNGEDYIGKTFTVKPAGNNYEFWTYREDADGGYMTELQYLTGVEYKLKVVGVFYASYTGDGLPYQIYVSNETGQKIEEMAVKMCIRDRVNTAVLFAKGLLFFTLLVFII